MKFRHLLLIVLLAGFTQACYKEIDNTETGGFIETPDWTELTHGNSALPDYERVFPDDRVLRFDLVIDPSDWEVMVEDLEDNLAGGPGRPGAMTDFEPVWVPCSVVFEETEWYKAGIRFKGNSSLQSTYRAGIKKLSFKLDFDQFEDKYPAINNQRFFGFKQLNLKNNFEDQSFVREKVASDLFREFGLVSPRCSFAALYVDYGEGPVFFGLYTLVEEVDDTVLDTQTGSSSGNLYKPDGTAASFRSGSFNTAEMVKKNNEDAADYADVKALYDVLHLSTRTANASNWMQSLEAVLDVPVFINWLAANTVMQNWDTYGIMTHNYYLYHNPVNQLLQWIPWDNNEALQEGKQGGALSYSLDEVTTAWPLIRYLIDNETYATLYKQSARRFVEEVFSPSVMTDRYDTYKSLIEPYALAEQSGFTFLRGIGSFSSAFVQLSSHVKERYDVVFNEE